MSNERREHVSPSAADSLARAPTPAHLEVVDLREHRDERLLTEIHAGLYATSFPLEERETLDDIRAGLWGDKQDMAPRRHFLVARFSTRIDSVSGFVACEYHSSSRSGLLSYIAVDPTVRRKGVARALLTHAIAALRRDAMVAGGPLAAVFAETHDPAKIEAGGDKVMEPLERA